MDVSIASLLPLNQNVTALDYHQDVWPMPSYTHLPTNGHFKNSLCTRKFLFCCWTSKLSEGQGYWKDFSQAPKTELLWAMLIVIRK